MTNLKEAHEFKVGSTYTEQILIDASVIQKFAEFSNDFNPIHFNDEAAVAQGFKSRIAHGMISASFFSKIFAQQFPGPGAVYLNQTLKFHAPVYLDETLTYKVEVLEKKQDKPIFTLKTEAFGSDQSLRISGEAIIKYKA